MQNMSLYSGGGQGGNGGGPGGNSAAQQQAVYAAHHGNHLVRSGQKKRILIHILALTMDFLIDGQISSFCPGHHGGKILTLIMLHKLTQSL